jgi:hypothetical protein
MVLAGVDAGAKMLVEFANRYPGMHVTYFSKDACLILCLVLLKSEL